MTWLAGGAITWGVAMAVLHVRRCYTCRRVTVGWNARCVSCRRFG